MSFVEKKALSFEVDGKPVEILCDCEFCPACGEALLDPDSQKLVSAELKRFTTSPVNPVLANSEIAQRPTRISVIGKASPFTISRKERSAKEIFYEILLNGKRPEELEACDNKWKNFLDSLLREWRNIFYSQSARTIFKPNFSRDIDAFVKDSGEIRATPVLSFVRQGNDLIVQEGRTIFNIPIEEALRLFKALSNTLIGHLNKGEKKSYKNLVADKTQMPDTQSLLELESGLEKESYPETYNMLVTHLHNHGLRMAARKARFCLNDMEMRDLLDFLYKNKTQEHCQKSEALRQLLENLPAEVTNPQFLNYKQGYILASWLRESLNIEKGFVNIVKILYQLGIKWQRKSFNPSIYALAVWEDGSPRILLNSEALRGRPLVERSSLAHELGHILVDSSSALPYGDLITEDEESDNEGISMERRAKAFAAELLLPRFEAKAYLMTRMGKNSRTVIEALASEYGVSNQIAANQVVNAHKAYGGIDRKFLEYAESI